MHIFSQGNVGLIFTKGDLKEVRDEIAKYKVGAPARVGLVAPIDVVVPPGNTGLDPSQTSFFQVRVWCRVRSSWMRLCFDGIPRGLTKDWREREA